MKSKQTQCGQNVKYGDFIRKWEVEAEGETPKELLDICFSVLLGRTVPEKTVWQKNVKYGGEKFNDPIYYFRGYYTMEQTAGKHVFTVYEPYAD